MGPGNKNENSLRCKGCVRRIVSEKHPSRPYGLRGSFNLTFASVRKQRPIFREVMWPYHTFVSPWYPGRVPGKKNDNYLRGEGWVSFLALLCHTRRSRAL